MAVRKIRWFRVYDDLVDDPKVQRLPSGQFRALINLWCLASANGGRFPDREQIGFKLRMTPLQVDLLLNALISAGLLDGTFDDLTPHNWNARQFKSDDSGERVRKHRAKQREAVTQAVTRNDDVTLPKRQMKRPHSTETDTESETERKKEEDPADAGSSSTGKYAFDNGGRIRLTQKSFDEWTLAYPNLELRAELWAMSEWADKQGDRWFFALSAALRNKNQAVTNRREDMKNPPEIVWRSGIEGVT